MTYFKKKHQSLFLAVTIGISFITISSLPEPTASATKKYKTTSISQFKIAKKPTYIYQKASSSSEKREKIQKNMGVVATGKKKNGFSQIRYGFAYAYVKTTTLKSAKPNKSKKKYAWAINQKYKFKTPLYEENSYMYPKFHKTYSTSPAVRNFWMYTMYNAMVLTKTEHETSKGLYEGSGEGSSEILVLKYPIKKNSKWTSSGMKFKIISTKATVKTSAGTFKNVVKVKTDNYSISYYAPNKGLIKQTTKSNGKYSTSMILIK